MDSLSSFRKLPSTKCYGIELECFTDSFVHMGCHHGFFYSAYDGSICADRWPQQAVEFVSQPLPKNWLKKEIEKLGKKFTWNHNESCGIHVHANKAWCTGKKGKTIAQFLYKVYQQDPAMYEEAFGREPNSYCLESVSDTDRYRAVNLTRTNTVEFRMFASGGVAWACYCVDMVDWLVSNCHHLSIDNFAAAIDMLKAQHNI